MDEPIIAYTSKSERKTLQNSEGEANHLPWQKNSASGM